MKNNLPEFDLFFYWYSITQKWGKYNEPGYCFLNFMCRRHNNSSYTSEPAGDACVPPREKF